MAAFDNKQYRLGSLLGKGSWCSCYELTSEDSGITYAAKIIPKTKVSKPVGKRYLLQEIAIHRVLEHPHVVKLEHFFENEENVYLLLECCSGGSLAQLLKQRKSFFESEARTLVWQVLSALTYLHGLGIMHRDLKLGNLLLDREQNVKLCDFGMTHQGTDSTVCGTPNYIAPEILDEQEHGLAVDMWSLGVVLYTLLVGTPPFETTSVKATHQRIRENDYHFPSSVFLTDNARSLIRRLLAPNPAERPTVAEVKCDPWFTAQPFAYTLK